jgi:hypothetical protein
MYEKDKLSHNLLKIRRMPKVEIPKFLKFQIIKINNVFLLHLVKMVILLHIQDNAFYFHVNDNDRYNHNSNKHVQNYYGSCIRLSNGLKLMGLVLHNYEKYVLNTS